MFLNCGGGYDSMAVSQPICLVYKRQPPSRALDSPILASLFSLLSSSLFSRLKSDRMLVEKRPQRHPIKRTTSMTELPYDPSSSDPAPVVEFAVSPPTLTDSESSAALAIPKRVTRRHSADYSLHTTTTAATADTTLPFLKSCCLCQIHFIPGRDIYMYRGDSAFCSSDCRKKQMKHDDRKQRSTRAVPLSPASTPLEGETVATTAV